MSELQTEAAEVEQTEANTGTVTDGADLATATGESPESKTEEVNQEAVNKVINKKHFEAKQAQREAEAARKETAELKAKLDALQVGDDPVIPPAPEAFDDDFEAKMKARDDALVRKAKFDAGQSFAQDQQATAQKQTEEAQQRKAQGMIEGFNNNAVNLGLDVEKVAKSADAIIEYGVSQDIANYILDDAQGPLMVEYLAANPMELESLQAMSPMQAAIKLNSDIRGKASSLKPQVSNAPHPTEVLSGGGVPEGSSPLLKGATFE